MAPPKYFCGQPTSEGPCDRLAVRRGRCHHHGGGPPRCLHPTPDGPCQKFRAYGGTVLACAEHGGGKRCVFPDCKTRAQKGEFCVTHTNCKTCQAEGCSNFIQSSSVMCREHSWMCHHPGCKVSRASSSFCTRHGGGRRCKVENCKKLRTYGDYIASPTEAVASASNARQQPNPGAFTVGSTTKAAGDTGPGNVRRPNARNLRKATPTSAGFVQEGTNVNDVGSLGA